MPHEQPRTLISESYRSLRTGLLLSSAPRAQGVAVTSAMAGEGKTATAANLAVVLAQLGRQVLLVDCDLRKPRLHQVFRVSNRSGLVNQLTATAEPGAGLPADRGAEPLAHPLGPDPAQPLGAALLGPHARLAAAMRARFDFVVIDTPPALAVTDATHRRRAGRRRGADAAQRQGHPRGGARSAATACARPASRSWARCSTATAPLQAGLGKRYQYYEAYGAEESEPKTAGKTGSAA